MTKRNKKKGAGKVPRPMVEAKGAGGIAADFPETNIKKLENKPGGPR